MQANGKARRVCVSDAVSNPDAPTLGYGETFAKGGIACKSTQAFLRCTNRRGHGFKLSRTVQSVF